MRHTACTPDTGVCPGGHWAGGAEFYQNRTSVKNARDEKKRGKTSNTRKKSEKKKQQNKKVTRRKNVEEVEEAKAGERKSKGDMCVPERDIFLPKRRTGGYICMIEWVSGKAWEPIYFRAMGRR